MTSDELQTDMARAIHAFAFQHDGSFPRHIYLGTAQKAVWKSYVSTLMCRYTTSDPSPENISTVRRFMGVQVLFTDCAESLLECGASVKPEGDGRNS